MNSYHAAILQATSSGLYPELCDLWRIYHPTSLMTDCEYFLSVPGIFLLSRSSRFAGSEMRRYDELKNRRNGQKRLYVPVTRKVTRKVSPVDRKNQLNVTCKVSPKDVIKEQKKTYEYQQSMSCLYSLMHG